MYVDHHLYWVNQYKHDGYVNFDRLSTAFYESYKMFMHDSRSAAAATLEV